MGEAVDIAERLSWVRGVDQDLCEEAANEIQRLRWLVADLRGEVSGLTGVVGYLKNCNERLRGERVL